MLYLLFLIVEMSVVISVSRYSWLFLSVIPRVFFCFTSKYCRGQKIKGMVWNQNQESFLNLHDCHESTVRPKKLLIVNET